ncbi:hypothetical protein [Acidihalobacter yilgarnensis]|nr:hypothetical protein [Acidihalobacter yilgarnensis]
MKDGKGVAAFEHGVHTLEGAGAGVDLLALQALKENEVKVLPEPATI